ncbi:hypothetical protein [Caulobacter sp. DWR1-3-2b1]|uniref:hypothetical protein n=1 Tax=Caulobacter sp. DWR1-3-2b1 TaxID=2804670 RepID=UPI003CECFE8F
MSFADDAEFAAFIGGDHRLLMVTVDAVTKALPGSTPPLRPHLDMNWLAMAVRRSLAITMRNTTDGPEQISNAEIRAKLKRLANKAGSTWLELFQCDQAVRDRLWSHAWHHSDGEDGEDLSDGIVMGGPSDYRRFNAALAELDWLANFMRRAAEGTESQPGPWRFSVQKRIRIERGQYLARIFEAAFDAKVSANNFPSDKRHKQPTAFMEFYRAMVTLAFGEAETLNLAEVVKEACRLHQLQQAQFAEGIISGL